MDELENGRLEQDGSEYEKLIDKLNLIHIYEVKHGEQGYDS
jgi:hypothetical protein